MSAQQPPLTSILRIVLAATLMAASFGAANNPFQGFPARTPPAIDGPLPPPPLELDLNQLPQVLEKPPLPAPPRPTITVGFHQAELPSFGDLGIVNYPGLLRWPSKLLIASAVETNDPHAPPPPEVKLLGLSSGSNPIATISVNNKIRHYQAGQSIPALEGTVQSITYNTVIISTPADILILTAKGTNP